MFGKMKNNVIKSELDVKGSKIDVVRLGNVDYIFFNWLSMLCR